MIFTPEEEGYGLNATLEEGHPLRFYPLDTSSIGHGTHVAGIIATEANNNTGIVGLSPLNSKLLPIKVFEKILTNSHLLATHPSQMEFFIQLNMGGYHQPQFRLL